MQAKIKERKDKKDTASELTKRIILYLRNEGVFCWRQNNVPVWHNGGYRQMPFGSIHGVPDILGFTNEGVALFIEIKIGRDKLSDAQKRFMQSAQKAGCFCFVAKDFETFVYEFRERTDRAGAKREVAE